MKYNINRTEEQNEKDFERVLIKDRNSFNWGYMYSAYSHSRVAFPLTNKGKKRTGKSSMRCYGDLTNFVKMFVGRDIDALFSACSCFFVFSPWFYIKKVLDLEFKIVNNRIYTKDYNEQD